jgi:hypothetical protein
MAKLPSAVAATAETADVSTGGFEPIKAGIYRARITKATLSKPSKDGNSTNAEWELVVLPDQGVREARLWYTASHKPEAAGLLKAPFVACGLTLDSDESEFVDEIVQVDVTVSTYQGRQNNKIRAWLPADGAVAKAASAKGDDANPWE